MICPPVWKVEAVSVEKLEDRLNTLTATGYEVVPPIVPYAVGPTLTAFLVVARRPLPIASVANAD